MRHRWPMMTKDIATLPGWWLGTLFFHILGISSSQLSDQLMSCRGAQPPTQLSNIHYLVVTRSLHRFQRSGHAQEPTFTPKLFSPSARCQGSPWPHPKSMSFDPGDSQWGRILPFHSFHGWFSIATFGGWNPNLCAGNLFPHAKITIGDSEGPTVVRRPNRCAPKPQGPCSGRHGGFWNRSDGTSLWLGIQVLSIIIFHKPIPLRFLRVVGLPLNQDAYPEGCWLDQFKVQNHFQDWGYTVFNWSHPWFVGLRASQRILDWVPVFYPTLRMIDESRPKSH